eukprot:NODE_160_length_2610_cov_83.246779_g123_i0.p1 GENE.NODE_160_length_2610_cov_83.246779_g123_i0~~NODE_160_length_2610_cov_83.246779_g123_i0.p1  ORF type:complete len:847 (-),score=336.49 NODE_160_length_2610_cov_83.246779_g123_i0:69-2522(-)
MVGFRDDERSFGSDAESLMGRFPLQMLGSLPIFPGVEASDEFKKYLQDDLALPYDFVENDRKSFSVRVSENQTYSPEELEGMFLNFCKKISETYIEQNITDAVMAVPGSWTLRQRNAIMDAAELAGINVLQLISSGSAAAMQWGVQNRDAISANDGATVMMVLDVGAIKTEATIVSYIPLPAANITKHGQRSDLGDMLVLSSASIEIGGRQLDVPVARHIAGIYKEKTGKDVLNVPADMPKRELHIARTWNRLMKTAEDARIKLSAGGKIKTRVEAIDGKTDFDFVIERTVCEQLWKPLLDKMLTVADAALAKATPRVEGVDSAQALVEKLTSIELFGGTTRIPYLQESLQTKFGQKKIAKTLNSDEAVALGAVFQAARLSSGFRVRSFLMNASASYAVQFQLSATESVPNPALRSLFKGNKMPAKKQVTLNRTADFNVTLYEQKLDVNGEPVEGSSTPITTYVLKNLGKTYERWFNRTNERGGVPHANNSHSIGLKFRLTASSIVDLESTSAKYDEIINVTKKVRVKLNETATNGTNATDAEGAAKESETADGAGAQEEAAKEEEGSADSDSSDSASDASSDSEEGDAEEPTAEATNATNATGVNGTNATEDVKYEYYNTTKTLNHKQTIHWEEEFHMAPFPLTSDHMKSSKKILKALNKRDDDRMAKAETRNALQSYLIDAKYDKLLGNEALEEFFHEGDRDRIGAKLEEVQEWLDYGEGSSEDTSKEELDKKMDEVVNATAPVVNRIQERIDAEKKARKEEAKRAAKAKRDAEKPAKGEKEGDAETAEAKEKDEKEKDDSKSEGQPETANPDEL